MIGQGNAQIRRMRTAFRPSEDASFNVRKENQKVLADHLKDKPFGEGLGLSGVEIKNIHTTHNPYTSRFVVCKDMGRDRCCRYNTLSGNVIYSHCPRCLYTNV